MDINPVYRSASKRPRSTSKNKYGKTPSTAPAKKRKHNNPNVNTSMNVQILNANDAAKKIINSAIHDYRNPKTNKPNGDDSTCTIYLGGQCDVISKKGKRHKELRVKTF